MDEQKNWEQVPDMVRLKLHAKKLTVTQIKKKKCITEYSSHVKLKAVVRWKERMIRAGLKNVDMAKILKKPTTRVCEWMTLTKEPNEDMFHKFENTLYKFGA